MDHEFSGEEGCGSSKGSIFQRHRRKISQVVKKADLKPRYSHRTPVFVKVFKSLVGIIGSPLALACGILIVKIGNTEESNVVQSCSTRAAFEEG